MANIIAISNEKGGVAKTTSTYSIGSALSAVGKKVLLIDLDPQGNLTLANGFEPGEIQNNCVNIFSNGTKLKNAILDTKNKNLFLIPSTFQLSEAESFLPLKENSDRILIELINAEILDFDYILMDCPPSIGIIILNALSAADLLIIPTQAEYFSAYALRNTMTLVRKVRLSSNPGLAYRILITMLDQRNKTHRTIREQLNLTFGSGLFKTVVEIDTHLRESPILGVPINQYRPNSRGTLQYKTLTEEIIEYFDEKLGKK